MKPIVIVVENGKIVMTPDEFKKHMSDAYNAGYIDGTNIYSNTTTLNVTDSNKWWECVTYCCDDSKEV